jgi:hypothetical protein
VTQPITGKKVAPKPASLVVLSGDWNTPDGFQVEPNSPFTVYFLIQNVGGKNTGPFSSIITCDDGTDSGPIPNLTMIPGQENIVQWPISGKDSGFYEFEIIVDVDHQVQAISPQDFVGVTI